MRRRLTTATWVLLLGLVIVGATPSPGAAAPVTLASGNSVIEIDPGSQAGVSTWDVDGVDNLFQHWFWYRIGTAGPESSIDTISAATVSGFGGTSQGTLAYENAALRVEVAYTLFGGAPGSFVSNLSESISITNKTAGSLRLSFFEYTDFDLAGTPSDDVVAMSGPSTVLQSDGQTSTTAGASVLPPLLPSRYEVNLFSATRDSLNDGGPTTLSNTPGPVGPGDVTWAFQWNVKIPAGGTIAFNTSLHDPVAIPEPATLLFVGVGALGVGTRRLFRRRLEGATSWPRRSRAKT